MQTSLTQGLPRPSLGHPNQHGGVFFCTICFWLLHKDGASTETRPQGSARAADTVAIWPQGGCPPRRAVPGQWDGQLGGHPWPGWALRTPRVSGGVGKPQTSGKSGVGFSGSWRDPVGCAREGSRGGAASCAPAGSSARWPRLLALLQAAPVKYLVLKDVEEIVALVEGGRLSDATQDFEEEADDSESYEQGNWAGAPVLSGSPGPLLRTPAAPTSPPGC